MRRVVSAQPDTGHRFHHLRYTFGTAMAAAVVPMRTPGIGSRASTHAGRARLAPILRSDMPPPRHGAALLRASSESDDAPDCREAAKRVVRG